MKITTTLAIATLAFALAPATSLADDVKDFVKRLKGSVKSEVKSRYSSSSQRSTSNYTPRSGGQVVRGSSSSQRSSSSSSHRGGGQVRSMSFASKSAVPTGLRSAASQNRVDLNSDRNGGARVSYSVDSSSKISRDDILFRKGSTEFADRYSYEIVRDLAYAMQDPSLRGLQFVIEGHASAEGSYSSNQRLSQRRAERIVSEMIRLGVDSYSLIAVGYGESEANYDAYAPEHLRANDRKVVVFRMD